MAQIDGMALEDAERASQALEERAGSMDEQAGAYAHAAVLAMNRGRAREGLDLFAREGRAGAYPPGYAAVRRLEAARFWDGDTANAAGAERELERVALQPPGRTPRERGAQSAAACTLEESRLLRGDTATGRRTLTRLRTLAAEPESNSRVSYVRLCPDILEALLAQVEGRPLFARLERLDSLSRAGADEDMIEANLLIARLLELQGNLRGALAAVRRREYSFYSTMFLSTYLREEGRLAARAGDRAGAIRAYRHYLALRSDSEAGLAGQVAQVQRELGRIIDQPRR